MRKYFIWLCLVIIPGIVFADADGPDYWEVRDVAADDVLNIRAAADWRSQKVGEIPATGRCIKNLGCVGGLTLEEFSALSDAEQQQILKKRPRWCEIEYHGVRGWVAGRYLREGENPCD
ncbi:MAG: SH3 domain-containing protein [Candidatus Competibacteraceae bacterium]|nr:SH3 domain-containing protein [Candidatus Competibacteraceae bacterium]